MSEPEYEAGGTIQVGGATRRIHSTDGINIVCEFPDGNFAVSRSLYNSCTYEPPKKEIVHEWLDSQSMSGAVVDMLGQYYISQRYSLNKKLTLLYGAPPIVRTYHDEEAEEFGLKGDDIVLWWEGSIWEWCLFEQLDEGDKWMLQPPAPKEDD